MNGSREEEKLLQSTAFQNAQSILQARQRAEEELVSAKEALEQRAQELARSVSTLRATLDSTTDAILVTGANGAFLDQNDKFAKVCGVSRAVVAGMDRDALWHMIAMQTRDASGFLTRLAQIESSMQESFDELELIDGRVLERYSTVKFVDAAPLGRVWSFRDVTERKQLDATRLRLAAVVESSDDAIVVKSLGGTIGTWNRGAERIFGFKAEEMVGRPVNILIPVERQLEEAEFLERLRRGERIEQFETVRVAKDGTRIDVSLSLSPVRDLDGRIVGASSIARDITARKRAEVELRRREEELRVLYERVVRAAEDRQQLLEAERVARAEAERANFMKDEFLATLSHELRTPLNAIVGWAQVLRARGHADEETLKGLTVIDRNAKIQAQLIDDLLDMSRIISGKVRLDVQNVDLQEVIESAIASVRHSADAREIRMVKVLDPLAGPVRGDPSRLQQCFWNLLSNAIKFTPRGGKVQVSLQRVNSHIEFNVTDNGQGIASEFLAHVFEKFRQADASTTRRHGGLGLGLSIVKSLVELHGGAVRASSAGVGHGSTFCIELPVMVVGDLAVGHPREHPQARTDTPPSVDRSRLDGITVLAVDDDADARDLLRRVLEDCGARVFVADSARAGLESLQREKPDILLSDLGMPNEDGYAFIKKIRQLEPEQGGRIPAVAISAFARPEDRTRAVKAGYQMHLAKPVEPSELAAVVASLALRR